MNDDSEVAWPRVLVGTAVAYAVVGWLALQLALPPSYAAPLYPSAGIALAAAWVYGRPALVAAALGAYGVNVGLSAARGQVDLAALLLPLPIALGAALQAALGCALVRRFVGQPLALSQPRDIWRFLLLAAPVACLANASIATLSLGLAGVVPAPALAFTWWTWWIGDSLGVLIGAPALLAWIGRPRSDWAPRRGTVAAPLLLVTGLLVAATLAVARWDEQRLRGAFEREAAGAADAVGAWLEGTLQALQATHGVFALREGMTREDMRQASDWWLRQPLHLQAIGFSERVARADIARFEAAVRAEGADGYRVFERPERPTQQDDEAVVIRHIEPLQRNAAALGVNALSIHAAAEAIRRAQRSGQASASAGFRLTQEQADQTGVVVYKALAGQGIGADGLPPLRGVVFVTLRMDDALGALLRSRPVPLRGCLVDRESGAAQRRLAGTPGCETAPRLALAQDRVLNFAGREWELRLEARAEQMGEAQHANAWLFSVLGLMAAALLGALLLLVTGRARRIERAVDERTAELRREVGERQRTEEALRASEQQLQAILDTARVGIVKTDLEGRILKANPAYGRLLGYGEDELRQRTVGQITHPDDRIEDARLIDGMRRGECDVYRREKRYLAKDGTVVHVQLTVALLRDAAGQPEFTVGVVEDIGEQLRLAEAERARELAESSNRAKSDFVSRMSHELRTPLNAMLGFAQLLGLDRKPALAEHQRAWAAQIQQAGWHLLHMINDTLDLSRIESGVLKLEPVALELAPLVSAAMAMVDAAAEKRGLRIEQKLDRRARTVMGDETRIKQVLTNLLSNAVKYNVDGGSVTLRTRAAEGDVIEIAVSDTGLGMTRAQMDDLFQPYNRLGRERSAVEGTGIGLVISRRLAELMGGSLRAQSVAGEGSTFILTLPRASDGEAGLSTGGELQAAPAEYRQRLVHYIEDNETNIEVMRGMLLRRPQVQLGVSMNGLDGLAAVRLHRPSLILLDMHLPDIDGLELLRHLKDDDELGSIPVVVVSADATTAHVEAALTAGAAHYVTKPVNLPNFLAILDELLDEMDTHFG